MVVEHTPLAERHRPIAVLFRHANTAPRLCLAVLHLGLAAIVASGTSADQ